METRMVSLPRYARIALAGALVAAAGSASAQSSSSRSQTVYLPDPTPRKMDNSLLLGDPPPAGTSTPDTVERRNAKRRQLVEWAASEMVTLSARLESDMSKPQTNESKAAADAARIEMLAKNLTAALKAQ